MNKPFHSTTVAALWRVTEMGLADGAYTRERLITRNSAHLPSEVRS